MATPPSDRAQAVQALAGELARLAAAPVPEAELLQSVLARLISAMHGLGGALWLVAQRSGKEISFRLGASAELETAAGPPGSQQREQTLRAASEVIQSAQPLVLMPMPPGQEAVTPGVLVNFGPHAIVAVPVRSGDDHLGALQLWFPREQDSKQLAEMALVLQALMAELGPRLRSRHLRELGAQSQRQQRLLQMASDLTGVLDPHVGAKLAAAHARDLLGINRVSLLVRKGDRWRVVGISGQDNIEHRAGLVVSMVRFVAGHAKDTPWVVVRTPESEGEYFADTQMQSAALVPLREGPGGRVIGSMLCESTDAATFGPAGQPGEPQPPALVLAQWLADLSGKALSSALAHRSAPMVATLTQLGYWGDRISATRKRRWLLWLGVGGALLLMGFAWPLTVKIEGDCSLLPLRRALITAEAPARIEEVLVKEGDRVRKDQVIARLDTRRLASELEAAVQSRKRLEAEAERQRGQGKEALARIAALDAQAVAETEKRLKLEIELAELRAPMDGIVMTKDVHLKNGQFLQAGEALAEVASVEAWDLRLEMPEADLSLLEEALEAKSPRTVNYLLYTQSARRLSASLHSKEQISPALQAGPKGALLSVTLPTVPIPEDLQPLMRPGLTGRAKIELDRRPAGAVLLRNFTRWLRMRWWL
ncbi:MAG TPA: efflux RND transporter periplasmic adaptor subunit [Prosthecobacter sp.]|nr:efflux RND transporter periplasmic adaptor subunit [Prosthecobacter sp.]